MGISCGKIFLLESKYMSLWSWPSLELPIIRAICVSHTHLVLSLLFRFFGSTVSLLVKKLLDKTPEERPSADSILSMASILPFTPRGDSKILLKERRYSLPNITPRPQRDGKERKKSLVPSDKENVRKIHVHVLSSNLWSS